RVEGILVELDYERPRVWPEPGRVERDADDLGVCNVRMIEDPYGDFGRKRIGQIGELAARLVHREGGLGRGFIERTLEQHLVFANRRRWVVRSDVLLVSEQIEQRRVDAAVPIEHAVLLGIPD